MVFERLTQHFERLLVKFGQLIGEQHAVMCQRYLARLRVYSAAYERHSFNIRICGGLVYLKITSLLYPGIAHNGGYEESQSYVYLAYRHDVCRNFVYYKKRKKSDFIVLYLIYYYIYCSF